MERSLLVRSALVALLLSVGIDSSRAEDCQEGNCQDRLKNNLYSCQGHNTIVGSAETCLQFVSPGKLSSQFDAEEQVDFIGPEVITIPYGCVCGPVGVSSPKFNASSKKFLCVNSLFGRGRSGALEGTVSEDGGEIVLRAWSEAGESAVYSCRLATTCKPSH